MDGRGGMRAADSDRQAVADRLRVALDEGRLDLREYDERLQQAYAARTYAELEGLVADLPAPGEMPGPGQAVAATSVQAGTRPASTAWLAEVWGPYLHVVAVVSAIWGVISVLSGELLYFWPAWVAGPWGAVLVVRTVAGLTGGEPRRWAVERERRRERRLARQARKRELRAAEPARRPATAEED